jgi:hypothetical protein
LDDTITSDNAQQTLSYDRTFITPRHRDRMAGRAGAPGQIRDLTEYVPVADDGLLRYTSPWEGPVVEAWRKT